MNFVLIKEGQKEPITESGHSSFFLWSVHSEVKLEAGNYTVYVGNPNSVLFFRKRSDKINFQGSFGSRN